MARPFDEADRVGSLLLADLDDHILVGRLATLASGRSLTLVRIDDMRLASDGETPVVVALDLGSAGAIDRIVTYRRRWPNTLIAASISVPDQERWHGAVAAGADVVANRGSFAAQLGRALDARFGGAGRAPSVKRLAVRLMQRAGDGLVGRLPDAPGGSVVVLRVGGRLHAIRDECPHAGASLADGTLDGTIITCPRHGSQFDVTTGARERGPSDFPIRTYRIIVEGDATFVEIPD
jgi:nitrite reductase/ring-hydroxylating ferredoxin subunit